MANVCDDSPENEAKDQEGKGKDIVVHHKNEQLLQRPWQTSHRGEDGKVGNAGQCRAQPFFVKGLISPVLTCKLN